MLLTSHKAADLYIGSYAASSSFPVSFADTQALLCNEKVKHLYKEQEARNQPHETCWLSTDHYLENSDIKNFGSLKFPTFYIFLQGNMKGCNLYDTY